MINEPVFKNMQHAIVEAMYDIGKISQYGDGSVRMKDLYSRVQNALIEVNGHVERGPHRFSIFNSALCGRRSAAELFERVEDNNRQGAWWKLTKSHEESLQYALEQKGFKKMQQRTRTKPESQAISDSTKNDIPSFFKGNKVEIIEVLNNIKKISLRTRDLRDENKKLEVLSTTIADDIQLIMNSKRESNPNSEILEMAEIYQKTKEIEKHVHNKLIITQKKFMLLSNQSYEYQK